MESKEPKYLCGTCRRMHECFLEGIPRQETCAQYQSLTLDELIERDEFIREYTIGPCPECSSEHTYDCDNLLETIEDPTVGHCKDCGAYWCLECGFIFRTVKVGTECPHWRICADCSDAEGYLLLDEFIKRICPACEHYNEGCQLDDPSECDKESQYTCPYKLEISECPKIQAFLESYN